MVALRKIIKREREIVANTKFLAKDFSLRYLSPKKVRKNDVFGNVPSEDGRLILYTVCDQTYFDRFAGAFINSAISSNPASLVHVHVVDPAPRTHRQMNDWRCRYSKLSFTFEGPLPQRLPSEIRRSYYASIRYVRVLDILQACRSSIFCLDVDSLIRGPLDSVLTFEPSADVLIPLRLKRVDWRWKVLGSAIFLRRTNATLDFAARLAFRMRQHLDSGTATWGIDQQCLYYTLKAARLNYQNLPSRYVDFEFREDSLVT